MGNGDVFDGDAPVIVDVPKVMASKHSSRSMMMLFGRLNLWMISSKSSTTFFTVAETKRFVFDPLEELVNSDIHISETTWHWLERPDHIQSLACKSCCRNQCEF